MKTTEADLVRMVRLLAQMIWADEHVAEHTQQAAGEIQRYIQNTYDESVWES